MKITRLLKLAVAASCGLSVTVALAGTEGPSNTFYGVGAGATGLGGANAFFGLNAGEKSFGVYNVYLGHGAGALRTDSNFNTFVGSDAGGGSLGGSGSVYLGYAAGYNFSGENELIIDTCYVTAVIGCDRPLIYGKFDARSLAVDGVLHVTAHRTQQRVRSQLHFSVTGDDVGGWVTSAGDNNFFTSSGARYDADAGGWVQRSPDGKAMIAGSGAAGYRVLTSSGGAVGSVVVPVSRLHIDYNGLMGVNTAPVAGRAINTSTGAYLSSGGVWTNASSRALKDDIQELSAERALEAFRDLKPVTFRYTEETAGHVGFIAEDVPALVATADRKGLSPMDVVAVLTKVVQEKSRVIDQQASEIALLKSQSARLAGLEARLEALAAEMGRNR